MSVRSTVVLLVMLLVLLVLLTACFIPFPVALGLRLSLFDFMLGALSGGQWPVSRGISVIAFGAVLLAIRWCIVRLAARRGS